MRFKPTFVQESVVAPTNLGFGAGAFAAYDYDLRTDFGAYLSVRFGRALAVTPTIGLRFEARPKHNLANVKHPAGAIIRNSNLLASSSAAVAVDAAAGATTIVANNSGYVRDDYVFILGSGGTRIEWQRVSRVDTGSPNYTLRLDGPLLNAHTAAQADLIVSRADVFSPVWLPGGDIWRLTFDNQPEAFGSWWYAADAVRWADLKTYAG